MNRAEMYRRLHAHAGPWDMIVVGGGATGAGVAIDAASRGYDVLLLEQSDFGKGTSSRSTKLVHGGVRYLEQGNVSLVMEALKERGLLLQNAPHLVHNLGFVVPNYDWWEAPFYGIGLKLYNLLAGKYGFGASRILSREETLERLPTLNTEGLRGGVIYFDGQFDDSRLLVNLVDHRRRAGRRPSELCAGRRCHQGRRRLRQRRHGPRRGKRPGVCRRGQGGGQRHRDRSPTICAAWRTPRCSPSSLPARASTWCSTAPFCPATAPSWSRTPATAA